mgnify:CR=1 FL=1
MATKKDIRRTKIKYRIRHKVSGTETTPRLTVFRSNKEIYAQLIDDVKGVTLASASTVEKTFERKGTKIEQAIVIGKNIAERAKQLDGGLFFRIAPGLSYDSRDTSINPRHGALASIRYEEALGVDNFSKTNGRIIGMAKRFVPVGKKSSLTCCSQYLLPEQYPELRQPRPQPRQCRRYPYA